MDLPDFSERVYRVIAAEENTRAGLDIPAAARADQARAFTRQLLAQVLTKLGDTLTSSRLVLAWMLSALAVPAGFIALLVPVRESLSLLPQLLVAAALRRRAIRKTFWVWGSVGQGASLAVMALATLTLQGTALGVAVLALLALFSLSRGVCSVAAKDVLGRTVAKRRRGRLTGLAASVSGAITLLLALLLIGVSLLGSGELQVGPAFFAVLLGVSALLWIAAAAVYAGVPEAPAATTAGGSAPAEALRSLDLLRSDRAFRRFVLARMLLVSTAFAIPYLVVLIQQHSSSGNLGFAALLLAEGLAGLASGIVWGYWADRHAERVMASAAALSLALILVVLALGWEHASWLGMPVVAGTVLFVAAVAHHGARIGRKTYLVDLATSDNRARYTAVSNMVIGVFLLCGGLLGWLDSALGSRAVLGLLALVAAAAAWRCATLRPVQ